MKKEYYWVVVKVADEKMHVEISEHDFNILVEYASIKNCKCVEYEHDFLGKLTKYYTEDYDGTKHLVCFRQILK